MPKASLTRDTETSLMNKKRSQTFRKRNHRKTQEQVVESSPTSRFLSIFRSKLAGDRDVKVLTNNTRRKMASGGLVKCPKCRKILQEPEDVSAYKCGECDTVLRVRNQKTDGKGESSLDDKVVAQNNDDLIPKAVVLSSGESSLGRNHEMGRNEPTDSITEQVSALKLCNEEQLGSYEGRNTFDCRDFSAPSGSKSPINKIYHGYDASVSYYNGRTYHFKGANIHERFCVPHGTPTRDKFPMISHSAMHMQARNSPYSIDGQPIRNWIRQGREAFMSLSPFYPTSPSPSSTYECASPFHQSCGSTSQQIYHDLNYLKCYGRLGRTHESGFSPMHFSREAFDGRYSQGSGQWPLPDFHYQVYYGHNFNDFYSSWTATPHKSTYTGYYPETEAYISQRNTQHEVNKYVRERIRAVKRHLSPTKGGAPFVTCYYCLEVLQVPQHFLVLRKKSYLLRCGGCSGVLKFSLRDKTHTVVPDTPLVLDSLPSHCNDTTVNDHDLASVGSGINGGTNRDAISCSDDDCGGSIYKGSSSDGDLVCLEPCHDLPVNTDSKNMSCDSSEVTFGTLEIHLKQAEYECEVLTEPLGLSEIIGEMSGVRLEQSRNEYENPGETAELDETVGERLEDQLEQSLDESSEALEPGETTGDGTEVILEESETECENMSEKLEPGETMEEKPVLHLGKFQNESENSSEKLESGQTMEEKPVFQLGEFRDESENSIEKLEPGETMEEKPMFHLEEIRNESENPSEKLEPGESMEEKPGFHLEELRNESENSSEKLEPGETVEDILVFHYEENRNENENSSDAIKSGHITGDYRPGLPVEESQNEYGNSGKIPESSETVGDRPALHLEEYEIKNENSSEPFKSDETAGKISMFDMEESENETDDSNESLDTDEATLQRLMFHLELSQDKQESSRELLEPGETFRERWVSISKQSQDELGETSEESLSFRLEASQNENETSKETFEPHGHFYDTVDPSEIVGLRQAIYPMQGSPLRSPLSSPLCTPIGSPLRYPIFSALRSPIVSPLRSPIGSPFPSSNGLFFGK